jgi:hypothetical protein
MRGMDARNYPDFYRQIWKDPEQYWRRQSASLSVEACAAQTHGMSCNARTPCQGQEGKGRPSSILPLASTWLRPADWGTLTRQSRLVHR